MVRGSCRVFAYCSGNLFHLQKYGVIFQIFETKNIYYACFEVNEKQNIADAADGSTVTEADLVVEYVTNSARARDST